MSIRTALSSLGNRAKFDFIETIPILNDYNNPSGTVYDSTHYSTQYGWKAFRGYQNMGADISWLTVQGTLGYVTYTPVKLYTSGKYKFQFESGVYTSYATWALSQVTVSILDENNKWINIWTQSNIPNDWCKVFISNEININYNFSSVKWNIDGMYGRHGSMADCQVYKWSIKK